MQRGFNLRIRCGTDIPVVLLQDLGGDRSARLRDASEFGDGFGLRGVICWRHLDVRSGSAESRAVPGRDDKIGKKLAEERPAHGKHGRACASRRKEKGKGIEVNSECEGGRLMEARLKVTTRGRDHPTPPSQSTAEREPNEGTVRLTFLLCNFSGLLLGRRLGRCHCLGRHNGRAIAVVGLAFRHSADICWYCGMDVLLDEKRGSSEMSGEQR